MITYRIIVCLLGLLAIQAASVTCLDEDLVFDDVLSRNIRSLDSITKNELKSPVKVSITSLIDSVVSKLLKTKLGKFIADAFLDTPNFVAKVNSFLGRNVLILNGNRVTISYVNLTEIVKLHISQFMEHQLNLHGILLSFAEGFVSKIFNDFSHKIQPVVLRANFTVPPTGLQGSAQGALRSFVLDVVVILLRPSQPRLNQTLLNVTNELLSIYKPVLPNNYFQSIATCGINQTILKVIEMIESIRETINNILAPPNRLKKRSADNPEVENEKQTRSLIDGIVGPIRSLLILILTPIHSMLKSLMNYVFISLRPVVGKVVLSPIESIVMSIINLIPCSIC